MTISKPTHGATGWDTAVDAVIDAVNALGELGVDARDFGAKFDGVTDDTAALQAFATYITTNGCRGYLPRGTAKITAAIDFALRPGWEVYGAGRESTVIKQYTNNTPIFNLGSDNASSMHSWTIRDLTFDYNSSQPSTNTSANPILFSGMGYQGQLRSITFGAGSWGIGLVSGVNAPWGCSFDDLWFETGLTGGAINWNGTISGIPNNHFGRILCSCNNMVGPVFDIRGYNFRIDTIEFLAANQGAQLMTFHAGSRIDIGTVKLENGTYTTNGTKLFEFQAGAYARIGHINIGGTSMTVNVSGGTISLVSAGTGATRVEIGSIDAKLSTLTAGSPYALNVGGGGAEVVVGGVSLSNGWQLHNNGATESGNHITVQSHVNGRLGDDVGDANYTVSMGEPNVIPYQTTLTAQRTLTLPASGASMFAGLYYDIVVKGAVNGANTLLIKAGATTLRTQATDSVALRYTWRRNTDAAAGWVLTNYQTLP